MNRNILVKQVIAKLAEKEVESFSLLEWLKKFIKLPTEEEAIQILKDADPKNLEDALKIIPSIKEKKSFSFSKGKFLILAALIVLLGEGIYKNYHSFSGNDLKKKIDKQVKVYEKKHPTKKHKTIIKKDAPVEIVKEKIKSPSHEKSYKGDVDQSLSYLRSIEKGLFKQGEKKLGELVRKDRDFFLGKYQDLNNLKGEELKGSLLRLRANLRHYEGSIWMGFVDKASQGDKVDDEKLFVQKDDVKPDKMDWSLVEKFTKW
jgi:hypothetical protein